MIHAVGPATTFSMWAVSCTNIGIGPRVSSFSPSTASFRKPQKKSVSQKTFSIKLDGDHAARVVSAVKLPSRELGPISPKFTTTIISASRSSISATPFHYCAPKSTSREHTHAAPTARDDPRAHHAEQLRLPKAARLRGRAKFVIHRLEPLNCVGAMAAASRRADHRTNKS
jgi:hypothetical protein